jgi:hypothetical protein
MFLTPTHMLMAMVGYSIAEQEYGGREEYARDHDCPPDQYRINTGDLSHHIEQYKQEYYYLMQYTDELKKLYTSVIAHAHNENKAEYPLPPIGIATSLKSRVTQLNFFEAGHEAPSKDQRSYKSAFAKLNTRSIYCELNLRHLFATQRIDFEIYFRWYHPELGHFSSKSSSHILPEWEYSWHAHGIGWNDPGNWTTGSYSVNLFIGDEYVAYGTFNID